MTAENHLIVDLDEAIERASLTAECHHCGAVLFSEAAHVIAGLSDERRAKWIGWALGMIGSHGGGGNCNPGDGEPTMGELLLTPDLVTRETPLADQAADQAARFHKHTIEVLRSMTQVERDVMRVRFKDDPKDLAILDEAEGKEE